VRRDRRGNQQTYVVQQDDLGSTLRVAETATNTIGSTSTASMETAVVVPAPPTDARIGAAA